MKNKRVLVTGGAGFIGSHLVKRLFNSGAEITVIVKYKSIVDSVRLSSLWNKVEIIEADLRNADSLRNLQNNSYDCVYHLAAYNHVGDSFLHVNESLMSNAVATANLLEFTPDFGRFIYMSSSEVYGFQSEVPFQEDFTPNPISPYAIGKYAGELYSRMKRRQTKQKIFCVRPFNTFGPYQSDRAIIPELIINCLKGIPIETTEGKQTREFNYVDNIIDALIICGEIDDIKEEAINIGSLQEIAICDLARKIHKLSNSKSELRIGALPDRPTEIWRMCADYKCAEKVLGWRPELSFDEGLERTIDWFRKYINVFYDPSSSLNSL